MHTPTFKFQHTAARRRLPRRQLAQTNAARFNTQPPEGGCPFSISTRRTGRRFQHTAARRRLRPAPCRRPARSRFNTQPPEGGCQWTKDKPRQASKFQHTAARRRLLPARGVFRFWSGVSTHSRPKAAASLQTRYTICAKVSTHSRPKAAASNSYTDRNHHPCFNTQPPEGGCHLTHLCNCGELVSTHSRPKAAAQAGYNAATLRHLFQHTAARRRLPGPL